MLVQAFPLVLSHHRGGAPQHQAPQEVCQSSTHIINAPLIHRLTLLYPSPADASPLYVIINIIIEGKTRCLSVAGLASQHSRVWSKAKGPIVWVAVYICFCQCTGLASVSTDIRLVSVQQSLLRWTTLSGLSSDKPPSLSQAFFVMEAQAWYAWCIT